MSVTIAWILGILRVLGLQGLSAMAAAWLNPVLKIGICIGGAAVAAIGVWLLWPSGNAVERAVLAALGERQTITNLNIDEEKHDNAWIEEYQKWQQDERDAAAKASGPIDRVLWRADDPWLRSKRSAKAR